MLKALRRFRQYIIYRQNAFKVAIEKLKTDRSAWVKSENNTFHYTVDSRILMTIILEDPMVKILYEEKWFTYHDFLHYNAKIFELLEVKMETLVILPHHNVHSDDFFLRQP